MFKTLMIHSDNLQLMDKVMQIKTTGTWVHHGNAATKMGALPGSFSTFVTAVPMMLWFSPYAACAVILLCHLIGYFFLRYIGYKIDPQFNPMLLVILFWLNPWRVEQSELYNPGYLFLFSGLHLYSLYLMREEKSFWGSFWLAICLGFCFQVHFSVLILGISFAYLFFTKKIKVNYAGLAAGLVIVAASLVPWLLQTLEQQQTALKPASDTFLGKNFILVYPVVKALVYFFRMGSVYFGRHIFSEINFDWITFEWLKTSLGVLFHGLKWILALVSLILSFRFFYSHFRGYKKEFNERSFIDHYMISLFVGVFGAASLSPVEFNHWHFVLCLPAIVFYICLKPEGYFIKVWDKHRNQLLAAIAVVFILWNIFASFGSRSHSYENDYELGFKKHYNLALSE
ncbi:hypothetical protein CIK05_07205 [Bdellovibrio sp. qaytius]|nr:hypothetical protein CIK05_07205 [Bdellovibrio sp. qaytius]